MSPHTLPEQVALLKVLADENRLRIVGILATRACTGGELAELLDLRAATVSHHLSRLREVGLLTVEQEGTRRWYRLDTAALQDARSRLLEPERVSSLVPEAAPDAYSAKVLRAFVEGDRIRRIPANRRKREVLLEWLAARFEVGEQLPESHVNERILRHHWDSATLRRELVAGGWMTRSDGVYTRIARD